jgi:hypothetical protein
LPARVGQHGLERFQVAVDVADNSPFQLTARFGAWGESLSGAPGDLPAGRVACDPLV